MVYVPGLKARAEYRAFTKRGGPRTLEIEQAAPVLPTPAETEATPLERELVSRGVTSSIARELVATYPEEQIAAQVEHFDWLKEKHPKNVKENPGGFLASAIRDGYAPQNGFESKADREKRRESEEAERRNKLDDDRRKMAEKRRETELEQRITSRWEAMTTDEQARLEAEALADADEDTRRHYEETEPPNFRRLLMTSIRRGYLRRLIEREAPSH